MERQRKKRDRRKKPRNGGRTRDLGGWTHEARAPGGAGATGPIDRFVHERVENLRLAGAVRAEIPDTSCLPGLEGGIESLAEYDRLLALGIDVWNCEGEQGDFCLLRVWEQILEIGALVRGEIRALLPGVLRVRVQATCDASKIGATEIWEDIRTLHREGRNRCTPPANGLCGQGQFLPADPSLEPWFQELTVSQLRTIAARHDEPPARPKEVLVRSVAGALRDPARLATCLGERLGAKERALLARYTAARQTQIILLSSADVAALAPDWDGRGEVPPRAGTRLRALGLLHLGSHDGIVDIVTQPEELRRHVAHLLLENHPDAVATLPPRRRSYLEDTAAAWGRATLGDDDASERPL